MKHQKFMLPHKFQLAGVLIAVIAILVDSILSFSSNTGETISLASKIIEILGLFIFINSREKVEDERIDQVRLIAFRISYVIAGIMGIVFLIFNFLQFKFMGKEEIPLLIISMIVSFQVIFLILKKRG